MPTTTPPPADPSSTSTPTANVGSGGISQGVDGSPFVLSTPELIDIQNWTAFGQNLPTNDTQLRSFLGVDAAFDVSAFEDLVAGFAPVVQHCQQWQNTVFPGIVNLAADISGYAVSAQSTLHELKKLVGKLESANPSPNIVQEFTEGIQNLQQQAVKYQKNADGQYEQLIALATLLEGDGVSIADLSKTYQNNFSSKSGFIASLNTKLAGWQKDLADAEAAYKHDVIVAATTPSYAWVGFPFCPVGLIAAAIVAGKYGAAAAAAAREIAADNQQISTLDKEIQADYTALAAVTNANTGLGSLGADLTAVTPVIEHLKGGWDAIQSDLTYIVTQLGDTAGAAPFVMKLDLDDAITEWGLVQTAADAYRVHAFIDVQGSPTGAAVVT